MPDLYALTEADFAMLKEMKAKVDGLLGNTRGRPSVRPEDDGTAPEVYVALTPAGGIPALTVVAGTAAGSEDTPGSATCHVYRVLDSTGKLYDVVGLTRTVYNMSASAVAGAVYVPLARDKWGKWWALSPNAGSSSGGFEIKEQDGSPDYTAVTVLTVDQADGLSLSQPGGVGTARLDILPVSATQAGIVSLADQILGTGLKTAEAVAVERAAGASNVLDASLRGASVADRAFVVFCHQATAGAPASYKECHVQFRGGLTYWTPFLGAFGMSTVVPSALYGTDNLGWLATCPSSGQWLVARYAASLTNNHAVYLAFNTGASYTDPGKAETNARCDLAADLNAGGYLLLGGNIDTRADCFFGSSAADLLAFYGTAGVAQQTVTGSRAGNAALQSLLSKLAALGLIVDSTS